MMSKEPKQPNPVQSFFANPDSWFAIMVISGMITCGWAPNCASQKHEVIDAINPIEPIDDVFEPALDPPEEFKKSTTRGY